MTLTEATLRVMDCKAALNLLESFEKLIVLID
jgi:hypothetical protein